MVGNGGESDTTSMLAGDSLTCAHSVVAQLLIKFVAGPIMAAKVLGCVSALDGRWTGAGSRRFRQIISAKALSYVAIVTYLTQ